MAVREGRRPDVRAEDARQADRRTAQAGGGRGRAVSACRRGAGRRYRQSTAGEPGAGRRGGDACTVLGFMSPWLVGFTVFFALSARDERVPVVPQVRPALVAEVGRPRELQVRVHGRPAGLAGGEEHALVRRGLRAAAVHVRVRDRADADAGPPRRRASSAPSSTSPRLRRRSPRRSASSTCSTPSRARSTAGSRRSGSRGRSGSSRPSGRSRRSCCSRSGGSATRW